MKNWKRIWQKSLPFNGDSMHSHFSKLKNGARVHLIPFSGTDAATILVLFKVGSRYEHQTINGASHFIEHLMFKGTKRRPRTMDISRTLDAHGAEYNAFTGKDYTGYYVKIDSRHLPAAVDLLHDMLFHSVYDPKEMDRERNVIIEEINMYRDNPIMRVDDLLEEIMFKGNTLGWNIAGSPEGMKTMTRDDVVAYRDSHYIPSRMVIGVAGRVPKQILPLLEKTFGKVKSGSGAPSHFQLFNGRLSEAEPRFNVEFKETEQIQLALGFPSFGLADKRNPAVSLLSVILGGTMSSRLFISVRERKGLAYSVRASNGTYEDVGAFTVQAGLDKSRLGEAVKTIVQEIKKIRMGGVSAEELREAKDHVRGRLLLKLEDSSDRADWYARQELFLDKAEEPEGRMRAFDRVSRAHVQAAAKEILDMKKLSVAVIGPFKDATAFRKSSGL